jgi:carboxypeptidase PM20D1
MLFFVTNAATVPFRPQRTVLLAFGHDEEVRGNEGAYQIAQLLESRKICLEFFHDEGTMIVRNALPLITQPVAFVCCAEKVFSHCHYFPSP